MIRVDEIEVSAAVADFEVEACWWVGRADAGSCGVTGHVGRGDGVVVSCAVVLAVVDGITGRPGLVVCHAVLAHWDAVLGQLVGDKVLAGLVDADQEVVDGLSGTCGGAEVDVERTTVPDAHAHVCIVTVAVERGIDGVIAQVGGSGVSGRSKLIEVVGIDVAIGASYDYLELWTTPLTSVCGSLCSNGASPKDTPGITISLERYLATNMVYILDLSSAGSIIA